MVDEGEESTRRAQQRVGSVINDKWTIERLLGVGGMGAVYAARHRNKKRAALKLLHPELSVDAGLRERFLREGYVANSVEHPGSVKVDDDGVAADGSVYLVVELLEGENLNSRWERKNQQLPAAEVLWIADQLLDVLIVAHAAGVVHRDLKPENVFLTAAGQLKVLDFGIARLRERGESSTATKTGTFMGTPVFMAPEQARGRWENVDQRTDLWAVGATMYTLLTGRYVHEGGTVNEILGLAMTQHAQPISRLMPELPEPVARLIDKSLAYEMEQRFENAKAMQDAVRLAQRASSSPARTPVLSVPDEAEVAAKAAATPGEVSEPKGAAVELRPAKGAAATAAALTITSPDAKPGRKLPALGVAITVAVVALAIGLAAWLGGAGQSDGALNAEPVDARASDKATPATASEPVAPAIAPQPASPDKAIVSVHELPTLNKGQQEKPASAGTSKPDKAKVRAPAQPAPAAAAAPAPATAKPKPASDPFSVRK